MAEDNNIDIPLPVNINELGETGLKRSGGRILEEFLNEFKGSKRFKLLTEMIDNEPLLSGTYFAIRQLIKQAEWTVKPASLSSQDMANAEFVKSCLHDMSHSWEDTIDEILSFIPYGFSVHEIVYKYRLGSNGFSTFGSKHNDGKIGWRKLPIRAQETIDAWEIDPSGGIVSVTQRSPYSGKAADIRIPIEKLLLFRTTSYKNNPEGRSIFRASYVPYYFKKRIQVHEAIGIERELNGIPKAKVPGRIMNPDATAAERAAFEGYKNMVQNLRNDDQAGIVVPSDMYPDSKTPMYDVELISTMGRRAIDTEMVLNRLNKEMLITVMADFMLLGHESVGSYALSNDKTYLFATAVGGFMAQIANVFNKHAIPRLFAVNGIVAEKLPELQHGDLETEDVKALAEGFKALTDAGVRINDQDMINELMRRMGFKTLEEVNTKDTGVTIVDPIEAQADAQVKVAQAKPQPKPTGPPDK